jgi:hypothetical protein
MSLNISDIQKGSYYYTTEEAQSLTGKINKGYWKVIDFTDSDSPSWIEVLPLGESNLHMTRIFEFRIFREFSRKVIPGEVKLASIK